jgi:2-methylisocitrate lyase-like PEP mutase family enzyme
LSHPNELSTTFRRLHEPGPILALPNAWDAGSARVIETAGAAAIATTSAGLAWSRGYPDGNALPPRVLATAVEEIAQVLSVPLSVDVEGGYSDEPSAVGETVRAVMDAGAVGINIEDGTAAPDLLCAKIEAARAAAEKSGILLFVNARCDVYLRRLSSGSAAVKEALARGRRYRAAGADGFFLPALAESAAIREIVQGLDGMPLNLLVVPGLPPLTELLSLGVRRVSAGSGIALAVAGLARRAAERFLQDGRYDTMLEGAIVYGEMNALFRRAGRMGDRT